MLFRSIEEDGFEIDKRVDMLISCDSSVAITKSIGLGVIGFADAFNDIKPDILVVLGDRYELLCASIAATIGRIPIAHIHGGEITEGAIDDSIRHCITKSSHLHFVATEEYRMRVIQMGESPERVFTVGGLGVDAITRQTLLNRNELEEKLGFQFFDRNLLVTFHPVTLSNELSEIQLKE